MSDDTPQPATPELDPFEQLLLGLSEPNPAEPAAPPAPAEPEHVEPAPVEPALAAPPAEPVTELFPPVPGAMPPTVAYTPEPTLPPTVAYTPVAAAQPPSQAVPGWPLADGDAETRLYPAATAATTVLPGAGGGEPPRRGDGPTGTGGFFSNRKALLWVLIGAAGLLVIALAILFTVLAVGGGGSQSGPSASPTATGTPRPTPTGTTTRTPSPTPTVPPAIQSFVADPMVVQCQNASSVATVKLSWSVVGATQVAVASSAGLSDAIDNPYQNNLGPVVEGFSIPFSCGNSTWAYTLTIAGADKQHRSSVITVTRLPFPTPTLTPTTPPAPPPAPSISDFSANQTTVTCVEGAGPYPVTLSWISLNGTGASIDGPGTNTDWPSLQPNGSQPFNYDCSLTEMVFTLTVTGQTSPAATAVVTVTNDGWVG